jgi:hypothetical protein
VVLKIFGRLRRFVRIEIGRAGEQEPGRWRSGREWPENATYNGGFFDKAMALCESMKLPNPPLPDSGAVRISSTRIIKTQRGA